jgi:5-formyltetrahydrofolate cyclo-ligase
MSESKETLREEARRHRARIDPASEDSEQAAMYFFDVIKPDVRQTVAAYWPKEGEFDISPVLERLLEGGYTCALPVLKKGDKELRFARWAEDMPLETGPYGISQPVISAATEFILPDIVIVPLLAFDRRGLRLGYGGGYYDRALRSLRQEKKITAVGICYAQQAVLFNLPAEDHDEKLDWVVTPQGAHYFE